MQNISTQHHPELTHHVEQGVAWLAASVRGEHSAALSYAAFELRFAVERIAVHYWATLLDREPSEEDLSDIRKLDRIQRRIYEIAGRQPEINEHFSFVRIVLKALQIDATLQTPDVGKLKKHWKKCSELCHITWPLSSSDPEIRKRTFADLSEVAAELQKQLESLGWPVLNDPQFSELRDRYVAGEVTEVDVQAHIRKRGVWARLEHPDGKPAVRVGVPIPPNSAPSPQ